MSTFMDFLTGGIQSITPQTVEATAPNVSAGEPKADIASRLKQDLQRDFGLNEVQAAAFVGNLAHESGGFKSLQEIQPMIPGSRGGYGYAQWTGPRRRQFEGWTAEKGLDPTSYDANYGFLKHELSNTPERRVLNALRQANDPATATQIVSDQFLRPGIPGMGSRQRWTQRVLGGDAIGAEGEAQPNRALAYAATRGRDPRANMPAPDATQAMGQAPMPSRQPMPDLSNTPDAGLRAMIAQQAGGMDMQGPSIGGLGGLGGMRLPGPSQGAVPATSDIESLIPSSRPHPFGFFGEAAMENQQAEQKRQGQIFAAKQLVAQGMSPQDAVAAINSPGIGQQLALGGLQQQKAAREQEALRQRLDSGAGGVPSPSPVQPGGAVEQPPQAAQPAQTGQPPSSPTGTAPSGGLNVQNKTVPALLSQRDKKVAEIRKLAEIPATPATESMLKSRMKGIEAEIGNIDEKLKIYAPTGGMKEYVDAMRQRQEMGEPVISLEQFDLAQKRAGATNVNVGGGTDAQVFTKVGESQEMARAAVTGLQAIRTARQAVEAGGFFGAGADTRLQLQKVAAAIGLADTDKITNTETFRSAIAPQVAAMMKATVGSTQVSNADREFAEKAAAGSITLDQTTITKLLGIMENANVAILQRHQSMLDKVYPDPQKFARERALFSVDAPEPPAPAAGEAQAAPPPAAPAQPSNVRPDGSSPPTPRGDFQEFNGVRIRRVQ
jgi:hypothetical protein